MQTRIRQPILHHENPIFTFRTFSYFSFSLFCKKVEKVIPSPFQITWQVGQKSRLCFKSRSSRKVHEKYTYLEKYAYISKCVHISREVVPPWDN